LKRMVWQRWKWLIMVATSGILLAYSYHHLRDRFVPVNMKRDLPSLLDTKYLKVLSLGHHSVTADFLLARAKLFQLANPNAGLNRQRLLWLKELYKIALELDPKNHEAFLMANETLKNHDMKSAIDILLLGMTYHPRKWQFPEMIGFNYFFYENNRFMAQRYFQKAIKLPNHPLYIPSMSERYFSESGRLKDAVRILYNFFTTTKDWELRTYYKKYINHLNQRIIEQNPFVTGQITFVVDGDSLKFKPLEGNQQVELKEVENLRLIGINAYEMTAPNEDERLLAHLQKDYTFFHLNSRFVTIEIQKLSDNSLQRDKYQRLLGFVFLENKKMYQILALENGMVKGFYKYPFKREYISRFKEAEKKGRENEWSLFHFPPPQISLGSVDQNIGKLVSVQFRVANVLEGEKNIFILPNIKQRNAFMVVVPRPYLKYFARENPEKYLRQLWNKWIRVSGFLGFYKNRPQIRLYFPVQLNQKI
jgi:endonuclease YncB( thermonuclease family)